MKLIKYISLRLALLFILFLGFNAIYSRYIFPMDEKTNGLLTPKLKNGLHSSDILFFSASPNSAYPPSDMDHRSMSEILDNLLPNHQVTSVDTGAIHAGIFKLLIEQIPKENNLNYIIVNMNYRSFGIGWIESNLENVIEKQAVFYKNRPLLLSRFLQGLNAYPCKPQNEREYIIKQHWKNDLLPFNPPHQFSLQWQESMENEWTDTNQIKLAQYYIQNYAFVINENNQRVKDFDAIVKWAKTHQIPLVFNILGENIEQSKTLVGADLVKLMNQNKAFLMDRYQKMGVIMVDNMNQIPDSCFYERFWPTEHYDFTGRSIVANAIAKEIITFEKNQ